MPVKQCTLLWGDTSTGKTALLATAAEGHFKATGKKARLVTAESAQSNSQMAGVIEKGIVEPWYLDSRVDVPFERIWQAVLGYWPIDPSEPLSPVIPAFRYHYRAECKACNLRPYDSEKAPAQSDLGKLKCPKCQKPLLVRTLRVANPDNGIDKIGMYLFEGLTEFGAMMMKDMNLRTAKGDKLGGDAAVRFQDGDLWIGGTTQSHYGVAQTQIKNRVDESKHLFGVDYVIWTAVRADDKDAKNTRQGRVFGPKVPGTAATSDIPRWFGPTLGTALVPKHGTMKGPEYRLYLSTYFQDWDQLDARVPNLCNNRIPPSQLKKGTKDAVPEYIVVDPDDTHLLWNVLQMIEARQHGVTRGFTEQAQAASAPTGAGQAAQNKS